MGREPAGRNAQQASDKHRHLPGQVGDTQQHHPGEGGHSSSEHGHNSCDPYQVEGFLTLGTGGPSHHEDPAGPGIEPGRQRQGEWQTRTEMQTHQEDECPEERHDQDPFAG